MSKLLNINKKDHWTLFLDRDGVINVRPVNDYVKRIEDFEFIPGAIQAICNFQHIFHHIFVVTNQQGVGMGRMSALDLERIHAYMLNEIHQAGGKIDKIYSCTDLHSKPLNCRKPGTQMAFQAKDDFPETDFGKSVMAGDTTTDILFGRALGMYCVQIGYEKIDEAPDMVFPTLAAFSNYLRIQQTTD